MPYEKITREKIIRAVLEASFVHGAGATSLSDISGILGIKKASLYNHYESREAMIADTIHFCEDYLRKLSFIPSEMDAAAHKYTVEAVLKGIVNRWLKLNEKGILFHIYSFLESEKYFSNDTAGIIKELRNRLVEQSFMALKSLSDAGKIKSSDENKLRNDSELFVSLVRDNLDCYLVNKKVEIRSNPQTGENELFQTLPSGESYYTTIDSLVDYFCSLIKL